MSTKISAVDKIIRENLKNMHPSAKWGAGTCFGGYAVRRWGTGSEKLNDEYRNKDFFGSNSKTEADSYAIFLNEEDTKIASGEIPVPAIMKRTVVQDIGPSLLKYHVMAVGISNKNPAYYARQNFMELYPNRIIVSITESTDLRSIDGVSMLMFIISYVNMKKQI